MTVRSPPPVTAMGLPRSSGLSRSTEAKRASMSTHRMIFAMAIFYRDSLSGARARILTIALRSSKGCERHFPLAKSSWFQYKRCNDLLIPQKEGGTMTKAEMVAKLAEVVDIQKKQAEKVLTELVGMIRGSLVKGERIVLAGLGSFSTTTRKARTGRNPRTGAALKIPARKAVKFSPAGPVKKEVNAPAGAKKAAAKAKPAVKKAPAKGAKKK